MNKVSFLAEVLLCSVWLVLIVCGSSELIAAQVSTSDHLADPGFWPTKSDWPRAQYVGQEVCGSCHKQIFISQKKSAMNGTAVRTKDSDILASHNNLQFSFGSYRYNIRTVRGHNLYEISDGKHNSLAELLWAFGTGRVGQSYLFKKNDGHFYESRVTYFSTLDNLNFTPDRALISAKNIDEAMYRPVEEDEVKRCFSCHTTAAVIDQKLDEKQLIPGVTCEACHGPGAKHQNVQEAFLLTGSVNTGPQSIFDPSHLNPADSVDFCGSCHGTWWDVKLSGVRGVSNVKSQPYRLESSKCWGKGDARLICVSCHSPHEKLQTQSLAYDRNCLACHSSSVSDKAETQHLRPCPVSATNCVSCHMPKVYVPEMHTKFTDHKIRIVKPGENYPD